MNHELVRELEAALEDAISDVFRRNGGDYPLKPSPQTLHLMAKAATTVYEAVMENRSKRSRPR